MDGLLIVLRIAHVGGGVLWVGAAWTFFLFVVPTLKALGPEVQQNFMAYANQRRRINAVIIGATLVTVVAGLILYWIDSNGLSSAWFQSGFGIGISIGAVSAIVAFLLGPLFIAPSFKRIEEIGASIGPTGQTAEQGAEMGGLGKKLDTVFLVDFVLLAIAVVSMATARYL